MLTFICYPKCSTCQKAKALLDSYHAQYEIRDIKTDNPSYDEMKAWLALSGLPVKKFFNTSGLLYKQNEWESVFEYDRKKTDKIFNDCINEMPELVKLREEANNSPRKTRVVNTPGGKVAVMDYDAPIINDGQSALDFVVNDEALKKLGE
jgi:arsenate reductase-like glutaredoxin family protein